MKSLAVRSLIENLLARAAQQPDAAAFESGPATVSYAELARSARAAAAWLHGRGIRAGDAVPLLMAKGAANELPLQSLIYGAGWLGAAVVPLDFQVPPARRSALVRGLGGAIPVIRPGEFRKRAPGAVKAPPRADEPGRAFLHCFSSGTTGTPKQMAFTHAGLLAYARKYQKALGHGAGDRFVPPQPFPSKTGLRYLWLAHAAGATLVNRRFATSRAELARLIREHGITTMIGAPAQLRALLATEPPPGTDLPPLRRLVSGAAFMSAAEIDRVRRELTPNLYRTYATTECGVIALLRPEQPPDAKNGVGRLLPEFEAQVADQDGAPLPHGRVGFLGFRSACIPAGYIGNPAATARHFRDGWFYPGDLGALDAQGNLSLSGRADHVINHGGVKIVPEDIDAVLLAHPQVADAALVGVPHAMLGEEPAAAVVLRGAIPLKALRAWCEARIEAQRVPAFIVRVEKIPRDASGKLRHALLRERLVRRLAARRPKA